MNILVFLRFAENAERLRADRKGRTDAGQLGLAAAVRAYPVF
jgi:hypothetical protein